MSARVMNMLEGFVPRVEVYSIDEAFLDFDTLKQNYNLYDFQLSYKNFSEAVDRHTSKNWNSSKQNLN